MTQDAAFPFSVERIAALSRLASAINGEHAPPPIAEPVIITEDGRVILPVPDFDPPIVVDERCTAARRLVRHISAELHAGLTLQWAPMHGQDGLLIEFRGGAPDGDAERDAVAVFLTRRGLQMMIADLQAIAARLDSGA